MKKKKTITEAQSGKLLGSPALVKVDEFKMIPRADLVPDPDQPRKIFSEASLDELALSIMEQGIVVPLIVRLVPARFKILEPDLENKEWRLMKKLDDGVWVEDWSGTENNCYLHAGGPDSEGLRDHYAIIAGERRWRASGAKDAIKTPEGPVKWEGLTELPCLVRDVDARRKFAQQLIENNQREGVSAIEEAEALEKEYGRRRALEPTLSKEAFAKEVGMSRADFYGTLVLTRLHPPVRAALTAGKISASLAKVVAMVPEPKQQEKLLAELTNEDAWNYPFSVRDAQEIVDEEYVKQLTDAPFSKTDRFAWSKDYPASVVVSVPSGSTAQAASMMGAIVTCDACPHRTGNMWKEFPELAKRPNVCTNAHCFAVKCKAHWLKSADAARTAGKAVLTETEFRKVKSGYVAGDKYEYAIGKAGTMEALMGKHKPEPVLVATKEGLQKFFKKDESETALKKNGVKFYARRTEADRKKEEEREAAAKKLREKRDRLAMSLVPMVAKGIQALKDAEAWKLALEHSDHRHYGVAQALTKHLKGDRAQTMAHMLGEQLGFLTQWNGGAWKPETLKLWKLLGVDLLAEEKKAAEKLPLAKPAAKQGELVQVKRNKKKGKRK